MSSNIVSSGFVLCPCAHLEYSFDFLAVWTGRRLAAVVSATGGRSADIPFVILSLCSSLKFQKLSVSGRPVLYVRSLLRRSFRSSLFAVGVTYKRHGMRIAFGSQLPVQLHVRSCARGSRPFPTPSRLDEGIYVTITILLAHYRHISGSIHVHSLCFGKKEGDVKSVSEEEKWGKVDCFVFCDGNFMPLRFCFEFYRGVTCHSLGVI